MGKGIKKIYIMFNEKNPNNLLRHVTWGLKYDKDKRCTNAFILISDPRTLRAAYETIKSKPGNMTKGSDNETLDGITEQ